jgi:hypothetical protein
MDKKTQDHIQEELERMSKTLFHKPDKVNPTKPIILYHGTSLRNFKKILKEGIKPRGKRPSNFDGVGISRPDLVYLTNCYAIYYAVCAMGEDEKDKQVILKIKIDPTKIKLYLDEEFIYHALQFNHADNRQMAIDLYSTINPKNLNPLIIKSFKKKITWVDSLNYLGTVSCDFIPKENIIEYAILDRIVIQDPSISPLNYKIMAGEYIYQLENLEYKKL